MKNQNDPLDEAITTMLAGLEAADEAHNTAAPEDDGDTRTPRELANDLRNGRW